MGKKKTLGHVKRAIERAEEDDRAWFEAHRTRKYRVRNIRMYEFEGNDGSDPLPEGFSFRVIVVRHRRLRERWPCIFPEWVPNSGERNADSDALIKKILEAWCRTVMTMKSAEG